MPIRKFHIVVKRVRRFGPFSFTKILHEQDYEGQASDMGGAVNELTRDFHEPGTFVEVHRLSPVDIGWGDSIGVQPAAKAPEKEESYW